MKRLSFCLLPLLFAGCVASSVPRTTITGTLAGKPFKVSAPKDLTAEHIIIKAGEVSLEIKNLSTRMNPEVITTTADGQVKMIEAVGEQIRAAAELAK